MACSSLHDRVPQRRAVIPGRVDLPPGIADVAHSEQCDCYASDFDVHDRAIWAGLLAEVGVGQRAEDCRSVRAPQAQRRGRATQVRERDRLVVGQVLANPMLIAAAVERAGYNAHGVLCGLHHREIRMKATVGVEPRRVCTRANAFAHLVDREVLSKLTRTGSG